MKLALAEPSDVTALPGGALLVVSDVEEAGLLVTSRGECRRVEIAAAAGGKSGFEAVAYDAGRKLLFVVREEQNELAVLRWPGTARSRPRLVDVRLLPALVRGKKKGGKRRRALNKGVEGMAFLPARHSPTGRAHLVLAKEAKPRALVLLDADGAGDPCEVVLDPRVEDACADFSGLAVDPISGHLFVCSDESATVVEVALHGRRQPRADLVAVTKLRDRRRKRLKRVEGVAIDEAGDLFVLLEDDRVLWRFERRR